MSDYPFSRLYLDLAWKPDAPGPRVPRQPKGSMCMSCQHKERDCSALRFGAMPVIEQTDAVTVVRCTEHVKAKTGTV